MHAYGQMLFIILLHDVVTLVDFFSLTLKVDRFLGKQLYIVVSIAINVLMTSDYDKNMYQ